MTGTTQTRCTLADATCAADTRKPTSTLTFLPNPISTRLTSVGSPGGTIAGTAIDNVGVTNVEIVIRRGPPAGPCNDNNHWDWNGTTFVLNGCQAVAASVASPGAVSTAWTYSNTPPTSTMISGANYRIWSRARDAAMNWSDWGVVNSFQDVVYDQRPSSTLSDIPNPTDQRLTSAAQTPGSGIISGTSTDDIGVQIVNIVIRKGPFPVGCSAAHQDWNALTNSWIASCTGFMNTTTLAAPGAATTGWTFTAPPAAQMTNGQYYTVFVRPMDSLGQFPSPAWQERQENILFEQKPDYVVDSLSITPPSPVGGESVTFSGVVRNTGSAGASAASNARLRIDINDDSVWDITVSPDQSVNPPLAAGGTQTVTWSSAWTAVAGAHRFEISADSGNAIAEANETNNSTTQTFAVGAARPNLRIIAFQMKDGLPGATTNATVTIVNSGGLPTGSGFEVAVNSDASTMTCATAESGQTNTAALTNGANRIVSITNVVLPGPPVGSRTAVAMVDSDCQIDETPPASNETDNTSAVTYTLLTPAVSCGFGASPGRIVTPPDRPVTLSWDCGTTVQTGSCRLSSDPLPPAPGAIAAGTNPTPNTANPGYAPAPQPRQSITYTLTCNDLAGAPRSETAYVQVFAFTGGSLREIRPQ